MIQPDNDCNICYNEAGIYKCNNKNCSWKMCEECTKKLINQNFKKCPHCQINSNFTISINTSPIITKQQTPEQQTPEQQNTPTITRQMYHSKWVTCQNSCSACFIKILENNCSFNCMLFLTVLCLVIVFGSASYIFTPTEKYDFVFALFRGWIIFLFSIMTSILGCACYKFCNCQSVNQ